MAVSRQFVLFEEIEIFPNNDKIILTAFLDVSEWVGQWVSDFEIAIASAEFARLFLVLDFESNGR